MKTRKKKPDFVSQKASPPDMPQNVPERIYGLYLLLLHLCQVVLLMLSAETGERLSFIRPVPQDKGKVPPLFEAFRHIRKVFAVVSFRPCNS